MNEPAVFDWPVLLAMRELQEPGERDVVEELLEAFLADLAVHVASLQRARAAGDYPLMARIAHRVRGSASVIGATQLLAAASALDACARMGGGEAVASHLETFLSAAAAARAACAARPGA